MTQSFEGTKESRRRVSERGFFNMELATVVAVRARAPICQEEIFL